MERGSPTQRAACSGRKRRPTPEASGNAATERRPKMGIEIPLLTPEYAADPRPVWKRLRGEAPVLWSEPFGFWVVSKYDDVVAMLKNPEDFSSSIGPAGGMVPEADGRAG